MIRFFLKKQLLKHKNLFFQEGQRISGFLHLLMKQRNGGGKWTAGEKKELRRDLGRLALYIPVLFIFLLPGGSILIPLLAEIMDRRKTPRRPAPEQGEEVSP